MSAPNVHSTSGFAVLENGSNLQTAVMTLEPGEDSGQRGNEHPASEQVLYVVEGEVEAAIGGRHFVLKAGDSTIVPREAEHQFTNRSSSRAVTFNVYGPPAY